MSLIRKLQPIIQKLDKSLTLLEFEEIADEAKEIIPDDWQGFSGEEKELVLELVVNGF